MMSKAYGFPAGLALVLAIPLALAAKKPQP